MSAASTTTLDSPVRIRHGHLRDARISVFAVMKDEQFYLPSFLDHHRRLGVEQFLILDDRSADGTGDLLAAQPDCVVLESDHTFGQPVPMPGHPDRSVRAAVAFKTWIPRTFLDGRAAICLDADEYLILPPEVGSLADLVDRLEREQIVSVAASLIDFYPATLDEMLARREYPTGASMLEAHGYFDALPLIDWDASAQAWKRVNESATARLFRKHRVKTVPARMQWAPRWFNQWLPYQYPKTSVSKTPIVRWVPGIEYANTHRTNVEPASGLLVGLAHVKFTYDLARRVDYALASRVYVRGSRKYEWYVELLDAMQAGDRSFLGPRSVHYRGPADLVPAGLARATPRN